MKNKRGFTLVELLAVIVVLSLVMIIAIPAISKNTINAREAVLKTKVDLIINESVIWGEDNLNYFLTSNKGPLKSCTEGSAITCEITFNDLDGKASKLKNYTLNNIDVKWIYERTKILYSIAIDIIFKNMLGYEKYKFGRMI